MLIAHVHALWLLVLAPLLAWAGFRSGEGRRWIVALLRAACVASVVLALSRPMLKTQAVKRTNVLVVDLGPTMPKQTPADAQAALSDLRRESADDVRVVVFANRAEVLTAEAVLENADDLSKMRERLARPLATDDPVAGGSALASALQLAGAQIAPEGRGTVRVLSNGLATRGDAEAEAYRLATRGVPVRVQPTFVENEKSVIVRHVSLPAAARIGQTATAEVVIESTVAGDARVTLTAGNGKPVSRVVPVSGGTSTAHMLVPFTTAGLMPVRADVSLDGQPSGIPSTRAATHVSAATRVLVVQQGAGSSAVDGLRQMLGNGAEIETASPEAVATRPLAELGVIVLADLPADELSAVAQRRLRQAVLDGTGLVVAGAARSFGPGGYEDSALASLLPVRMPQQMESIDPSTTLVLIIDSSGSMEEFERMDLAKEIARLAISHLKAHDKLGIVEFYGGKRWASPIQSAANTAVISRALSRLTTGGGTTLYPAVEEASFALRSVQTRSKHVLIVSDGGVENAPFASLLRQMAEDGIATSAVAIAPTAGMPNMMPDIARWGGGRFYSVPDRFALPDITLKQPHLSLLSPVVQRPAKLVAGNDAMSEAADIATWAAVNGYVRTTAKPTADVLLKTADGDPLLVRWRYGAGFVAAMPTQIGSAMTRGVQDEPGFAAMIAGLFRQIGTPRADKLTLMPIFRPTGLEVNVTASDPNPMLAHGVVRLTLVDEKGVVVRTASIEPVGIGRWNVLWPGVTAGAYTVTANMDAASARGRAGVAVLRPEERLGLTADRGLLDRVAAFEPLATRQAARSPASGESFVDLRNALAAAAVVLLLLHVTARRWPVSTNRRGES